ncbi:MAG: hypothetical protein WCJ64_22860 [Rhodospirillaceae bacterium]
MAPAEKTEGTVDTGIVDRDINHREGINSGAGRGFSSPVLSDKREADAPRSHTGFASVGGWVVSR